MGKSLTETAKSILMKEGAIPSVSPMDAGHPDRDATQRPPNMQTLRPGSRGPEGRFSTPGSTSGGMEEVEDLGGQTPTSGAPTDNMGAKASGKMKKDPSRSGQSAVSSEPYGSVKKSPTSKVMEEKEKDEDEDEDEKMDEEFEISEELEAFIDQMMEEGYSEEQIAEAIAENFEIVEENEDESLSAEHKAKVTKILNDIHGKGEVTFDGHDVTHNDGVDKKTHRVKVTEKGGVEVPENPYITSELDEEKKDDVVEKVEKEKFRKATAMKEHVNALLAGENLSEDFREKAETIFESAVSSRVQEEVQTLEEAYAAALEEEVENIRAQLTEQIDDYLNYVVEQWVEQNEVAIESGLRSELTEDFISGLRNLFAEHYIDIPEDKVSIVEELGKKVESLETKLNEEIDRNVSLSKMINESKQFEILVSACDGLTNTQAEKLKTLAENVEFTTPEDYASKVVTLRESYFPSTVKSDAVLDNNAPADEGKLISENLSGPMAAYVRTLGKTLVK